MTWICLSIKEEDMSDLCVASESSSILRLPHVGTICFPNYSREKISADMRFIILKTKRWSTLCTFFSSSPPDLSFFLVHRRWSILIARLSVIIIPLSDQVSHFCNIALFDLSRNGKKMALALRNQIFLCDSSLGYGLQYPCYNIW